MNYTLKLLRSRPRSVSIYDVYKFIPDFSCLNKSDLFEYEDIELLLDVSTLSRGPLILDTVVVSKIRVLLELRVLLETARTGLDKEMKFLSSVRSK